MGVVAHPAWEGPRQTVQLDVGIPLLGLGHEPPFVASLFVTVSQQKTSVASGASID